MERRERDVKRALLHRFFFSARWQLCLPFRLSGFVCLSGCLISFSFSLAGGKNRNRGGEIIFLSFYISPIDIFLFF